MLIPAFLVRIAPTSLHQWYLNKIRRKLAKSENDLFALQKTLREGFDYKTNNPEIRSFISCLLRQQYQLNRKRWRLVFYINKIVQPYKYDARLHRLSDSLFALHLFFLPRLESVFFAK